MAPETSIRRPVLFNESFSVIEHGSSLLRMATRHPRVWLLGTLLMASGCQSTPSLSGLFSKPKLGKDKSVLSVLDRDKKEAGLPPSSRTNAKGESLTKLLDRGQDALANYYKDENPSNLKEARRSYEQALAVEPGNPESHHGLAIVCDLQRDFTSAELHYRAALEGNPNNAQILGDLGYSYLSQNRLSESEALLLQATKLDPGNTLAWKNLGTVYAKEGNYNLAESTFHRVMNEVEVRQEMAQLFPQGRPDMAREGESGKLPWQKNDRITTDQFAQRMNSAREQSANEMRDRRTALEMASPPTYTIEQQQAMIARLTQERDEALRMADARTQRTANSPLVLDGPASSNQGGTQGMQIQPQFSSRPGNSNDRQFAGNGTPSGSGQPPQGGRRVPNGFYPDGPGPQYNTNPGEIQQAGVRNQPIGPNGQPIDQAYHETTRGIDPRTGMPLNRQIQQTDGQAPLLIPNGLESSNPGTTTLSGAANYEEAKRRAALVGLGGPEMMFPIANPEGGNRMAPGSGSTFNGGQYPQPQRMLPTDAAPHDLNQLMHAPSGNMTVQPNNMGMLNSPAGQSFSNPNLQQRLTPEIPIQSPLGNQGMNYGSQVYSAQQNELAQQPPAAPYGQSSSQLNGGGMSINPRASYDSGSTDNFRNGVNSELNQYGQSFQHNPAQYNSNSWIQTPTPANGLPNQPQAENPSQMLAPSWNQQQFTPRITPPPYPGRPAQSYDESQSSTPGDYGSSYGNTGMSNGEFGSSTAISSEPAPIYSPGVQVPAAYNGGSRATNTYGQSFDVPRITPAGR